MIDIAYLATGLVVGTSSGFIIAGLMAGGRIDELKRHVRKLVFKNMRLTAEIERRNAPLIAANTRRHAKAIADREARQAKVIARHAMQEAAE